MVGLVTISAMIPVYGQVSERWFPTDGPNGGPVVSLMVDSYNNVFAGTFGGVFRLRSGQPRWERLDSLNTRVFTVSGQGDTIVASGLYSGLVSSQDGGRSWRGLAGYSAEATFVERSGVAFFGRAINGFDLQRSTDGGVTWSRVVGPSPTGSEIKSLTQGPDGSIYVGTTTKVYRFALASSTWSMPLRLFREITSVSALGDYVVVGSRDGVHVSTDGTLTWSETPITNIAVRRVAVGLMGITYAASSEGVFVTRDSGKTWAAAGLSSTAITSLTVDTGGIVYAGTAEWEGRGVYRSTDQGQTWALFVNGLTSTRVWAMVGSGSEIFAATLRSGLHRSEDDGRSWRKVSDSFLVSLSVHPDRDLWGVIRDTLYRSSDNGATWTLHAPTPQLYYKLRRVHISPNGSVFLVTRGNLHRTTDRGVSWKVFTPAFGAYGDINNDVHVTGNAVGTLFAALEYNTAPGSVFVQRSTDNGDTWTPLSRSPSHVRLISASDQGHVLTVSTVGLSRSTDNGESWRSVNVGVPTDAYVERVTADAAGTFYAATDKGVIRLPIGAAIWEKMPSVGLPGNTASLVYVSPQQTLFAGALEAGLYLYGQKSSDVAVDRRIAREAAQLSGRQSERDGILVTIVLPEATYGAVSVYGTLGTRIDVLSEGQFSTGETNLKWPTHGLPRGLYLLVFRSSGIQRSAKVVVR